MRVVLIDFKGDHIAHFNYAKASPPQEYGIVEPSGDLELRDFTPDNLDKFRIRRFIQVGHLRAGDEYYYIEQK